MTPPLSPPDIIQRARTLLKVGLALLWLILAGALGFELSQRQGMAAMQVNAGHRLELFAATVDSLLNRLEHVPATIQLNQDVLAMLNEPGQPSRVNVVNGYLKELNSHLGSMVVYILNERGMVVAASNSEGPHGFVGEDLSFRPYFLEALAGGVGRHFAIGNTQGVPGYYLSNPIRDGQRVVGVAVIKISLQPIEQAWSLLGVPALIADENKVVILSSQADWRYSTLVEQTVDQRVDWQVTQRYNLKTLPRFPLSVSLSAYDPDQLTQGVVVNGAGMSAHLGAEVLAQALPIDKMHWQLMIFSDLGAVRKQAVLVSLLSCVAAGFVLLLGVVINQRRRILAQKLESKRVLEQANAELENKVTRRTKALSDTNLRLRQEVNERVQAERTLRAAQDELVQAAKLAVLGQLATGITHELAQPLSAIRTLSGNTSEFLKRGNLDTVESNLGIISRLADQMGGIIHPLKGFARKAPASPAITDVGQAVNNALLLFNSRLRSEEVALVNDCPEGHTLAWCDPNRLEQVIVNLIGNALDAMREAPVKTLDLRALSTGDGWIKLTVSDTGSGIPEHLLPRLFEPFFTTKPVGIGLGLGLSISQDIVREFRGQLAVENLAVGGARFVLLLPEKGAHEH